MSILGRRRLAGLVALGISLVALVAVVVLLNWGHGAGTPVSAQESATVDWSIGVEGETCSTAGVDTKCTLDVDETFTLNVSLDTLPSEITDYTRVDVYITYSGVGSKDNVTTVWPQCGFPAPFYSDGEVAWGCTLGIGGTPSTYTGVMITNDFNCTASGTITLNPGATDTNVQGYHEAATESLTINCGAGAEPTATPTPTATATATTEVPVDTPTPTATTEGPTATPTATTEGPVATATPTTEVPTPTNTSVPPTATNTSVPPTATSTPEVALGDVNCDGTVNSVDALWVLWVEAYLADLADLQCPDAADMNADGVVDAMDALFILWTEAGQI